MSRYSSKSVCYYDTYCVHQLGAIFLCQKLLIVDIVTVVLVWHGTAPV